MSRLLELLLKVWSGVLVASALLWLLPSGVRHWVAELSGGFLRSQFGPTDGLYGGIQMGAYFTDDTVDRLFDAMPQDMMLAAHEANGLGFRNQGDVNIGWSLQFFPHGWQHVAHAALNVIPLLVMAVLWWWLATAVAQSRRREVFTLASAKKLTIAGAAIALGGPLVALATWLLYRGPGDLPVRRARRDPRVRLLRRAVGRRRGRAGAGGARHGVAQGRRQGAGAGRPRLSVADLDDGQRTAICEALDCDVGDVLVVGE